MSCDCDIAVYKKSDPSEIIEVGDIIMLDIESGFVTRAISNSHYPYDVNNKLIIGICSKSDNDSPLQLQIDGGSSKELERSKLDGGDSLRPKAIVIYGGDSNINSREIIEIEYAGECVVNLCGPSHIGDKLCISNLPGKAKTMDYFGIERVRSIGKIIKYQNEEKTKAMVLLDIE